MRPDAIAYLTGALSSGQQPSGISLPNDGGKFATDGSMQLWPGNTIICHVDPASTTHQAIREIQEDVKMIAFVRLFKFLPPSSFHMTVFQGYSPTEGLEGELRQMRTALRNATGLNMPGFDDYVFHISPGYLLDWLSERTAYALVAFSADLTEHYREVLIDIPLGPVEFCNFDTIHHFEPLKRLV